MVVNKTGVKLVPVIHELSARLVLIQLAGNDATSNGLLFNTIQLILRNKMAN